MKKFTGTYTEKPMDTNLLKKNGSEHLMKKRFSFFIAAVFFFLTMVQPGSCEILESSAKTDARKQKCRDITSFSITPAA